MRAPFASPFLASQSFVFPEQSQTEQSEDRRGGNELAPDKLDKPSSYT